MPRRHARSEAPQILRPVAADDFRQFGDRTGGSQSTLSRFFGEFTLKSCEQLAVLHPWALWALPSARCEEGYAFLEEVGLAEVGRRRVCEAPRHRRRGLPTQAVFRWEKGMSTLRMPRSVSGPDSDRSLQKRGERDLTRDENWP